MSAERPLDSGRRDVLGRTVRVAGDVAVGRAVAPAPDGDVDGECAGCGGRLKEPFTNEFRLCEYCRCSECGRPSDGGGVCSDCVPEWAEFGDEEL